MIRKIAPGILTLMCCLSFDLLFMLIKKVCRIECAFLFRCKSFIWLFFLGWEDIYEYD